MIRNFNAANLRPHWNKIRDITSEKTSALSKFFDDFLGVSEVVTAQREVQVAEDEFLQARKELQDTRETLREKAQALKDTRRKLDRCSRDDEHYLSYVSEEHRLLLEEKEVRNLSEMQEENERDLFTNYASAVRVSHEQERVRAERTKYWSIIGSISGTILGFLGSSIITYYRFKQIRDLASAQQLSVLVNELKNEVQLQTVQDQEFKRHLSTTTENILHDIQNYSTLLQDSLHDIQNTDESKVIPYGDDDAPQVVNPLSEEVLVENIKWQGERILQNLDVFEKRIFDELSTLKLNESAMNENKVKELTGKLSDIDQKLNCLVNNLTILEDQNTLVIPIQEDIKDNVTWVQKANIVIGVTSLVFTIYSLFLSGR